MKRKIGVIVNFALAGLFLAVVSCSGGGGGGNGNGLPGVPPPPPPPPPPSAGWMSEVGSYTFSGYASDVKVLGNYAYVAADTDGLKIIDISNPAVPILAGTFATGSPAYQVTINGIYVYVSESEYIAPNFLYPIEIVNVSNPASPALVGSYSCSNGGSAKSLFASAGKLYAFCNKFAGSPPTLSGWLEIINVSNPASPTLMGTYAIASAAFGGAVYANGNYAYLGVNGDVLILDVSNPASPSLVSNYNVYEWVNEFVVNGDKLYISIHNEGAGVFNISSPASPELIGKTVISWQGGGIAISGNYMYFTTNEGPDPDKLIIYDVSNPPSGTVPQTPSNLNVNRSSATSYNITWSDNANNETGYQVIRWGNDSRPEVKILLGPNTTSYQDTGLSPCEEWGYAVVAYNANGGSFLLEEGGFESWSSSPAGAPAAPSGLTATPVSSSQINLTWTDSATNELGYCLTAYPSYAALPANTTNHQSTGLTSNTQYQFVLRAYNAFGSSTVNWVLSTTLP